MTDGRGLRLRLCGDLDIEAPAGPLPTAVLPGRQGRVVFAYLVSAQGRAVRTRRPGRAALARTAPGLVDHLAECDRVQAPPVARRRRSRPRHDADVVGGRVPADPSRRHVDRLGVRTQGHREGRTGRRREWITPTAVAAATEVLEITGTASWSDPCEWVDEQETVAGELCIHAQLAVAEAQLLAGAPGRAAEAAREAVDREPGREAGYRLLMRALAATGERAEAMRVWERCRTTLVEELGVDPSRGDRGGVPAHPRRGRPVAAPSCRRGAAVGRRHVPAHRHRRVLSDVGARYRRRWRERSPATTSSSPKSSPAHGGTLLKSKLEGDATVSVFARATSGAGRRIAVREAIATEPWPEDGAPSVRMALHTGEAFERDGDYFGPALNRPPASGPSAWAGQILLSQASAELVVDHLPDGLWLVDRGHRDLRGLSRGEDVSELTTADPAGPMLDVPRSSSPATPPRPATRRLALRRSRPTSSPPSTSAFEGTRGRRHRGPCSSAGEPGVGKSRLAAEWAERAHRDGAIVLYGRCEEDLGAPLQPFVEGVRHARPVSRARTSQPSAGHRRRSPHRARPRVAAPRPCDRARADPDSERSAVFDALGRLLTDVASDAPLVLVLDDLHWAGRTTLLLLRHLLRHAEAAPVLVLATYRDTELARTHPLADAIADLHRDGTAERITLGRAVVRRTSPTTSEPSATTIRPWAASSARVTAGNPFFLIEVAAPRRRVGRAMGARHAPPRGARGNGRRLSRLSDRANDLLHVAAVVGTPSRWSSSSRSSGRSWSTRSPRRAQRGSCWKRRGRPASSASPMHSSARCSWPSS